jgi:hypothetical protein
MQAEEISTFEKIEILSYKIITYIPVAVTFGVFIFLLVFYSYVSKFRISDAISSAKISYPYNCLVLLVPDTEGRLLQYIWSSEDVGRHE